jgi:hypothetical protein
MLSSFRSAPRAAAAIALFAAVSACGRGGHAQHEQAAPHAVDWAEVSDRDLDIASVFLVARDQGLRPALDSLGALTRRDPQLELMSHAIAHGLGRYAEARSRYDLATFAQCRPSFNSGCYHGVLEAYLSAHPGVDPAGLRAVCTSPAVLNGPPYAFRECAHGMGHGLSGVRGHDLYAALGDCDAVLPAGMARGECYDGAFMENVVHGMGMTDLNVGGAVAMRHEHERHDRALLKPSDPYFPCDSVAEPGRQPSCWAYQPVVFYAAFHQDVAQVIDACRRAPAAAVSDCFRGMGKQTIGRLPLVPDSVITLCRRAGGHTGDCLEGVAEFYVDREWQADSAFTFCTRLASAEKPGCYRFVGRRVAWIDPAPAAVRAACAAAGPYAATCAQAAESEHAAEVVARDVATSRRQTPPARPPAPTQSVATPHHHRSH